MVIGNMLVSQMLCAEAERSGHHGNIQPAMQQVGYQLARRANLQLKIHLTLGLLGNLTFFVGSALFLPALEEYKVLGVWLFIIGSFLMLIGSIGRFLVDIWEEEN